MIFEVPMVPFSSLWAVWSIALSAPEVKFILVSILSLKKASFLPLWTPFCLHQEAWKLLWQVLAVDGSQVSFYAHVGPHLGPHFSVWAMCVGHPGGIFLII